MALMIHADGEEPTSRQRHPEKKLQDFVSWKIDSVENLVPLYSPPRPRNHSCKSSCRSPLDTLQNLDRVQQKMGSPILIPMSLGWARLMSAPEVKEGKPASVYYMAPCGATCSNPLKVRQHLLVTESCLSLWMFSFENEINPTRHLVIEKSAVIQFEQDSAGGVLKPYRTIPAFNCYSKVLPSKFTYVKKNKFSMAARKFIDSRNSKRPRGCSCIGPCSDHCECRSFEKTSDHVYYLGRLYGRQPWIMECNRMCTCSSSCEHRNASLPNPFPLALYFYPDRGWGVRAACDIPIGSFVGFYCGEIITDNEVNSDCDKYLMSLDIIETKHTDRTCGPDETVLNIDCSRFGNVARFFNHSCAPNIFVQAIHRDYFDPKYYEVAFFTSKNIVAGTELVYDYGYQIGSVPGRIMSCLCGSESCKGRML